MGTKDNQEKAQPSITNFVENSVVNALIEAIFDILDNDGKRSILRFAGREDLMGDKLPPGRTSREEFSKILNAMRILLEFSSQILFEIGRKFSVYLDPFGTNIQDFVQILNNSFRTLQFSISTQSKKEILINIKSTEANEALLTDPWLEFFYRGVFLEAVRKSIGGKVEIEQHELRKSLLSLKISTEYECI